MKNYSIFITALTLLSLSAYGKQDGKLLPSEALVLMYNEVDLHPEKERIQNTKPFQTRVITEGLSGDELFYLGETYFWNFMPKEAAEAYANFLEENSPRGRAAWQRYLQIQFRAFEKHDLVEQKIKEYQAKYKPIPEDRAGMIGQVWNIAERYRKMGNHEKVVELVNAEIATLDYNGAYSSFQLPGIFFMSYKEAGRIDEAIKMISEAKAGLNKTLEARKSKTPEKDFAYVVHSAPVRGMDTVMTEKLSYQQMTEKFEGLINSLSRNR